MRTLLKIHSIELHAKLLRARELPALLAARVDPLIRAWVRHFARGSDGTRVGGAQAHILGLACVSWG